MNGLELRIEDGGNGKLTLEGYASRTETAYHGRVLRGDNQAGRVPALPGRKA